MEQTLKQLGELLLASIPSMICLLVVWGAYRFIVYGKMQQVLAERHARTEGAIEQAQAEIATAESRTAEYEQRVREARAQIYKSMEERRKRVMEQRQQALVEARAHAAEMVKGARATLEHDMAAARAGLQKQAESLAEEIIQSILKPAAAVGSR